MSESHEYQVTARKWRPTDFASVAGQEHITQTLKNAIKQHRVHHAYLFSGPRGVGKTTTARILARALNCQNLREDGEPCNECESCRSIAAGRSMDVVEIDGASNNSVEDIRGLRDNAKYPPVTGNYKLYIIDEVHMLSTSAFNALLKTLEEPPRHLVFIFATTEPHKVLATILSRCQRFDFRRMQIEDIVDRLRYIADCEGMKPEDDALVIIARKGDGSMRDAQSIFDQVVAFCGSDFTYEQVNDALNLIDQEFFFRVTAMMRSGDPAEAFEIVDYLMRTGYDSGEFLVGLAEHFRNLLSVLSTGSGRLIETTASIRDRYVEEANALPQGDVIRALHLTLAAQGAIRTASQPRLRLELLLIQLASMDSTVRLEDLMNAIRGMPDEIPATPATPASSGGAAGGDAAAVSSSSSGGQTAGNLQTEDERKDTPGSLPSPPSAESPGNESEPQGPVAEPAAGTSHGGGSERTESETGPIATGTTATTGDSAGGTDGHGAEGTVRGENGVAVTNGADGKNGSDSGNGHAKAERLSGLKSFPTMTPQGQRVAVPAATATALREEGAGYANGSAEDVSDVAESKESAGISIARIHAQWGAFLESCDDRKSLVAALHAVAPGEVLGNVIRLFVENEFQAGLVREYYEGLVERFRSFFGVDTLTIECVVGLPPVPLPSEQQGAIDRSSVCAIRHPDEDHPFIKGIVDLLGAVQG